MLREHLCRDASSLSGKCLDFAKIVKHENGVTVLLTSASYQVLTGRWMLLNCLRPVNTSVASALFSATAGQLVHDTKSTDLLELLAQQQLPGEEGALNGSGSRCYYRCFYLLCIIYCSQYG